jgi:hypothetical protein
MLPLRPRDSPLKSLVLSASLLSSGQYSIANGQWREAFLKTFLQIHVDQRNNRAGPKLEK